MAANRKRMTEREVIAILIRQKAVIPCCRCRVALTLADVPAIEREHLHPIALGGADDVENAAYSHRDCHAVRTRGSGATTAGSDIGNIAKTRRLEKKRRLAEFEATMDVLSAIDPMEAMGFPPPPKRRKQSFPKGRKIPSRPITKKAKK